MENRDRPIVPGERPRPSVFAATGIVLGAAIGLWIASFLATLIAPEGGARQEIAMNLIFYLPFILLPIALYGLRRRPSAEILRLNPMPVLPTVTVVFLALMSVYAASSLDSLWTLALNALGLHAPKIDLAMESRADLTLAIITTAALPAIFEELLFRSFVFAAWEDRGTRLAMAVSTLMFALLHGNLFGLPAYLMVGAVSAYLVFSLDSLYAGITYHTVYNAAILVIMHLLSGTEVPQAEAAAVSVGSIAADLFITAALMMLLIRTLELRRRLTTQIRAIPRAKKPLRAREWAVLAALAIVMLGTMLIVLLEV